MKTYKLWIEIEEYDDTTEEYKSLSQTGEAEPVPIGEFETLEKAIAVAESYATYQI
jgi:hypothetical protein